MMMKPPSGQYFDDNLYQRGGDYLFFQILSITMNNNILVLVLFQNLLLDQSVYSSNLTYCVLTFYLVRPEKWNIKRCQQGRILQGTCLSKMLQ